MGEKKICKSICRMCGSGCGIEVTVEDNKVVRISGDKDNHINRGRICKQCRYMAESAGASDETSEKNSRWFC